MAARARDTLTDFSIEGMIHACAVRSPIARGAILSIDFPRLPSGYRSILPADIPGENRFLSFGAEMPLLAAGRVSYVGQPVALVTGPDPLLLEELASRASVKCAEEEPRLDWESFSSDQVAAKRIALAGDPDLAFSIAASAREDSFTSGAIEHWYGEPQGAAAAYDYDKIAVWCATQWPYHVRDSVAIAIGCEVADVSVRPTRLGVHLDGKLWYPSLMACHAALAAVVCGHPAKILLSRKEDFLYSPKRARSSINVRSALDSEGNLSAIDVRIAIGIGAYGPLADEIVSQAVLAATGAYSCPNARIEGYAVLTDTVPSGAFGGLGASHSLFAVEAHLNRAAAARGEDPVDWKSRNVLRKGGTLVTGDAMREAVPYDEIAVSLLASSDYRRKYACYELVRKRRSSASDGPLRGIGFAFAYQGSGAFSSGGPTNSYTVEAALDKDLALTLRTSAASAGGGALDIWRQTAAEILGIEPGRVLIAPPVSGEVPDSGPSTLSRNVTVVTRLVAKACAAIQKRRFRDPLPLTSRSVLKVPRPIRWADGRVTGSPFEAAAWAGAVAEVELDSWTFEPRALGLWLCVDGGRIVSPVRAAASLRSGAVEALGSCLRERVEVSRPRRGSDGESEYFRYGLQSLRDLPPISVVFIEGAKGASPKGIGELPLASLPAAFISALSQAAGYPFSRLPVPMSELIPALETT